MSNEKGREGRGGRGRLKGIAQAGKKKGKLKRLVVARSTKIVKRKRGDAGNEQGREIKLHA